MLFQQTTTYETSRPGDMVLSETNVTELQSTETKKGLMWLLWLIVGAVCYLAWPKGDSKKGYKRKSTFKK